MEIIKLEKNKEVINKIKVVLQRGGLVVIPTDTVYGLAADATNKQAVKKLLSFKDRPVGKPVSVFVSDFEVLEKVVNVNEETKKRLKELLPGPFTIVLSSKHKVSPLLESEKRTLGVRFPDHEFVNGLVAAYGKPLTATSANLAGRPPCYSIEALMNQLPQSKKNLLDLVIDAGKLPHNKPSTVLDFTAPTVKVLREGDINQFSIFPSVSLRTSNSQFSNSEKQTKQIAQKILKKALAGKSNKPIVFILQGELGTGKTVFVKGIGEYLDITNIISPTFVVYYEYPLQNKNVLVHADLYNVSDPEEFKHLGLENYLKKGNILAIEWGEKAGEIFDEFKKKAHLIYIEIKYKNEKEREIKIF